MATSDVPVSEPTLRRLPTYHHLLARLAEQGRDVVSCPRIAEALDRDPTRVRKDLAATGASGRPRVGYEVAPLLSAIEDFLGWNNLTDAFLVGVGSLGTALLGYDRFKEYGLNIVAGFDVDPAKVGKKLLGREILPLDKLPNLARRMHVRLGVLTAPAAAAQEAADRLVEGGVRGIWNFAPIRLQVPEGVVVQDERLSASLAVLTTKLRNVLEAERPRPARRK